MENNCPCCENHCPQNDLHCHKGREHFGIPDEAQGRRDRQPATLEEKVLMLLRRCGHFLHHNAGRDSDAAQLLRALTPEEQQILALLLEKSLNSWQSENP